MSPEDLHRLVARESVRLRPTGVELSSCARRLRAHSSELLGRLRSMEEHFLAALRPIDALLLEDASEEHCEVPTLPDEVLRTSQAVRKAAEGLVERGRELADQANRLVHEARAGMAAAQGEGGPRGSGERGASCPDAMGGRSAVPTR